MNLLSLLESKVYAAAAPVDKIEGIPVSSVNELVTVITNILIIVGVAVVVIFLAMGFIKYITSGGDKNAVDSAQKTLTYAVIGGVGLLIVYGLRTLLLNLLNAQSLEGY
ncbi:TPA: hypothetical protein DHW62_02450 [candidate division WWE3 bacterium]|uniref:Uncharacterized protein n=1 Tax=candidate division WWE3 bacterium TaxID=2053526 RepID=A0A656PLG3_UNCKA|nr:hypothetical protein P147_WWE3C00001G0713 [candidate division WWE3 bacterium RAAC2_WWE3_1]KKS29429.1 MAG: hypothetical protein UU91_C0006G0082 [candidate division WWE3 bacterium GW2011_GWB1_42_117]KKS54717.1 MAG: hypothetical protein UV21_C0005G0081 [candidate division WWE3 bacterium GW2011_GWD2_42_34]KKT05416.1 MAG: hypothetical protein UV83_C0004G0048 [candidate division WWE3 bacterium GW2011_GWE2_43_18]KKT06674.1 MAG: hypothetical protein UV84_C0005G0060 [candidate division WWE3 bacterium